MRELTVALAAASLIATSMTTDARSRFTPEELDRMSRERGEELQRPEMAPPPASTGQEDVRPTTTLFRCMSTDQEQAIYAAPSTQAAIIGRAFNEIAVSGQNVNGFAQVLSFNGRPGFVPVGKVRPFVSDIDPALRCTVTGVHADGSPVFDIR